MAKFLDLTGKRFGRLIAIHSVGRGEGKDTHTRWLCKCDCGNKTIVASNNLQNGNVKSCGCLKKEVDKSTRRNLTGQRFGRLTALEDVGASKFKTRLWRFRCDCGNEVILDTAQILSGNTSSCGCYNNEVRSATIKERIGAYKNTAISLLKNQKLNVRNKTGYKGVRKDNRTGKYIASIGFQRRHIHLGVFDSLEEAAETRKNAEEIYWQPIIDEYNEFKEAEKKDD